MQQKAKALSILAIISLTIFLIPGHPFIQVSLAEEVWTRSNVLVAKPGDILSLDVSLRSARDDTYILLTRDPPEGWTINFYYGSLEVSSVNIKRGETITIRVEVKIPRDAPPGEYSMIFCALSPITNYRLELPIEVKVLGLLRSIEIKPLYPQISIERGQSFSIQININNRGERDEKLVLSAIAPKGWSCAFKIPSGTGAKVDSIYLAAGGVATLLFEGVPLQMPETGEQVFTLKVSSEDNLVNVSCDLKVNVIERSQPILSCQAPVKVAQPGQSTSFQVKIMNPTVLDQSFRILVKGLPSGWKADIKVGAEKSISLINLRGSESAALLAELYIPENATYGTYNITLAAESDYLSESITLQILVQEVAPLREIEVKPLHPRISVEQGQSFSTQFTVINRGEVDEELILNIRAPDGWGCAFKPVSGASVKINSIRLAAGGSANIVLEAIPLRILKPGENIFTLEIFSVDGFIRSSLNLKVDVTAISQPILLCQTPLKVIKPGSSAVFQVQLVNPTIIDQAFKLLVKNLPEDWSFNIKVGAEGNVTLLNVRGGGSVTLAVEILTPENASDGAYPVELMAGSNGLSESIQLHVIVRRLRAKIDLKATPPYLDAYSGSKAQFRINVLNSGEQDELLKMSSSGLPEDFRVEFRDSAGKEITAVYVEAGSSKDFLVVVSIPAGAELGVRRFKVLLSSNSISEFIDLALNVLGFYNIEITNRNFYTSLNVGGEGTFTLNVKNTGSMDVTNVRVAAVSVPEGLTVNILPESIPTLKVNQEGSFTIVIRSEPNINAGNYYIDFYVSSDQTERLSFTLRTEVFQTVNWLLYAGILVLIAIISLFIIYRRFGRR